MRTTIYGYIEEMDFWKDPIRKTIREYNSNAANALPTGDHWPPLSKEMFAICENKNNKAHEVDLEYSGRIIHFGANLKSIEQDWEHWKSKFETFLSTLYFLEARVHFKTEYSLLETSSWRIDLLNYKVNHDGQMPTKIKHTDWQYESTFDR